ncbi:uncharacterized protein VTP21DRAFT_3248 [Calcarisporiella thermophila]|uniref:uncharacterized protein n=1 Tax=Calcarisporiella thermophila TaxID=911321 RepID=UPI003742936F
MWIIEGIGTNEGVKRWLRPNKQYVLGRTKLCDFSLLGDKSVSRKHAVLDVGEAKTQPSEHTQLILSDLNSKFGVFVNDKRVENTMELKDGDQFKLGVWTSIFKVYWKPAVLCVSGLQEDSYREICERAANQDIRVTKEWITGMSTHFYTPQLVATQKLFCALLECRYIVGPTWLEEMEKTAEEREKCFSIVAPQNFEPPKADQSFSSEKVSLRPVEKRRTLFAGLTFLIFQEKQFQSVAETIRLGQGRAIHVALGADIPNSAESIVDLARKYNRPILVEPKAIAVGEKTSEIYKAASMLGMVLIPEHDIGYAVLYANTDEYCNPNAPPVSTYRPLDRHIGLDSPDNRRTKRGSSIERNEDENVNNEKRKTKELPKTFDTAQNLWDNLLGVDTDTPTVTEADRERTEEDEKQPERTTVNSLNPNKSNLVNNLVESLWDDLLGGDVDTPTATEANQERTEEDKKQPERATVNSRNSDKSNFANNLAESLWDDLLGETQTLPPPDVGDNEVKLNEGISEQESQNSVIRQPDFLPASPLTDSFASNSTSAPPSFPSSTNPPVTEYSRDSAGPRSSLPSLSLSPSRSADEEDDLFFAENSKIKSKGKNAKRRKIDAENDPIRKQIRTAARDEKERIKTEEEHERMVIAKERRALESSEYGDAEKRKISQEEVVELVKRQYGEGISANKGNRREQKKSNVKNFKRFKKANYVGMNRNLGFVQLVVHDSNSVADSSGFLSDDTQSVRNPRDEMDDIFDALPALNNKSGNKQRQVRLPIRRAAEGKSQKKQYIEIEEDDFFD